jgi:hypothetical protein
MTKEPEWWNRSRIDASHGHRLHAKLMSQVSAQSLKDFTHCTGASNNDHRGYIIGLFHSCV